MSAPPRRLFLVVTLTAAGLHAQPPPPAAPAPAPSPATPADAASPAAFPAEIRLSSGAILRKTSLVRWTTDGVVVRHAGGVDPIRLAHVAEPDHTRLRNLQTARPAAPAPSPTPAPAATVTVGGSIQLPAKSGPPTRFPNATVVAFPGARYAQVVAARQSLQLPPTATAADHLDAWQRILSELTPLGDTVAGPDGKFSLLLPAGQPVFLVSVARRGSGRQTEHIIWLREVPAGETTADLGRAQAHVYYSVNN